MRLPPETQDVSLSTADTLRRVNYFDRRCKGRSQADDRVQRRTPGDQARGADRMLGRAVRESQHQEIALSGPRGRRLDDAPGAQGQAGRTGRNCSLGRGRDREAKTSREEHQGDGEELLERFAKLVPEQLEDLSPAERRNTHQMLQVGVSLPKQGGIGIRLPFLIDEGASCREETASYHCL